MSKKWKDDFIGTGSMKPFVDQHNELLTALSNIIVKVPSGYSGAEPTLDFEKDSLVFDFGEALIFTLNNVKWNLYGTAAYVSYSVKVLNGQLVISVTANDIP